MNRRIITALGVVACAAVATVAVVVADADGYSTRHVDLGDGGVWAVSEHDGLVGRVNLSVGGLDATVAPPGSSTGNSQLDVVQDAVGVVARDRAQGRIYPVDAADGTIDADSGVAVSPDAQVAIGGGTVALLDPSTGKVWARRFDPTVGLANLTGLGGRATPVATIGRSATGTGEQGAALAVGADGAVHAVSAQGRLATVTPTSSGLAAASYRNLRVRLRSPQLTAVGPDAVVLDAATGALVLPGGRTAMLPDRDPATELQQPGPDSATVVAATSRSLFAVDLGTGRARSLGDGGTGTPAAPLVVGDCAYLAWTGTPGRAVRSCGGGAATTITLADSKALVQPQLRVNRGAVVVNDAVSGGVWQLPGGRRVDNWAAVKPPTTPKPKRKNDDNSDNTGAVAAKPHAVADNLGARPGRATTLHVLDNDSDPAGTILSITAATLSDSSGAQLDVAPDGQTVQVTMPSSVSTVRFRYTVNDTKNLSASAAVTVTARPSGENKPPNLRPGFQSRTVSVAAGGKLSLPVIGDWRDFDGDPPVLASAQASAGTASTTPDGRVDYIAPVDAGTTTVSYSVTDGMATTKATVNLTVLGVTSSQTTPATAEPDVARGQVGQPIVIRPLDNDLPGADPTEPGARISLASAVPEPDGTSIVTDLNEGTVTVTAERAGTFVLNYLAAFGNAAYAKGSVRVDVSAAADRSARPIAVLDTATLHGQRPVTADVLGNDFDPAGRVLVVTSAGAQDDDQLQVAIVQGKYLRINALTPELGPNPQIVNYVITDGVSPSVTGQVSVNQLPESDDGTPVPQDDFGTVRAGDSVTVPVLDNDTDPNGDTLSLAPDVKDAPGPGRLTVSGTDGGPAGGSAYAAGTVVRYVAPTGVTTERQVTVDYVVRNGSGDQAVGKLFLTVVPLPSTARPDQQPTPPEIDRRVVAGDTVTIPIRTSLVDPDGDAVTLTGIGTGPQLGRVLEVTASALRYQAYPTSAGTDSFSYTVTDRFGKVGQAALRIAVVAPGDPQPPVASDITVGAAPGSTVTVDVLAQAFVSPDDVVGIEPLDQTNSGGVPGSAKLLSTTGPIRIRASSDLRPVVLRYAIGNGLGAPSTATLRIRTVAGTDLPPVAADNVAKPVAGRNAVTVDPLARATDPDAAPGAASTLRVTHVFDPAATISANKVTLPVLDRPQIVPYEIADGGGAAATAVIFVPAQGAGVPTVRPGVRIDLDKDASKSIDITSYAVDPAGKPLTLTSDQLSASPATGLRVRRDGATGLVLTAQNGYVGPAAVTFQVTDGTSLTDPDGVFGVITVPVQVGPETPVLRCPTSSLPVVEGGGPLDLDVSSLCHVWVADPSTLADLEYTALWSTDPGDITLSGFGSHTLHVAAAGGARPNSLGVLKIGVVGKTVQAASLKIVVQASPPPSVSPVTIDGLVAGKSATVDLTDYVQSRLRGKAISVVNVAKVSGLAAKYVASGPRVTITPGTEAKGTLVFAATVTDITNTTVARRQATGRITVHVLGKPDAPTGVAPGRTVLSHSAVLSWQAPANNGEPIGYYQVSWDGGQRNCPASPCTITGLRNAVPYRFTVRAHNAVGLGRPSARSAAVVPDQRPSAPTGLRKSDPQDHKLTISWQAAKVDGTPVLFYLLRWPGGSKKSTSLFATASGLDNDALTRFSVVAVNKQGAGPPGTVSGQSSGTPQYPAPPADPQQPHAPNVDPSPQGDHQDVRLSWPAIDPNGPGKPKYTVVRSAGDRSQTVCVTTARTCTDRDVANDGTDYDYTYSAANGTGNRSATSARGSFVARGTPGGIANFKIVATGDDGKAELHFDQRAVLDKSASIRCRVVSDGNRACGDDFSIDGPGAHDGEVRKVSGLDDGSVTISLQQCNTVGQCSAAVQDSAVIYGQLQPATIENLHASGPNIDFVVHWSPRGGQVEVGVKVVKDDGEVVYDQPIPRGPTDGDDHSQAYGDDVNKSLGTPISVNQNTHVTVTVTVTDVSSLNRRSPDAAQGDVRTGPFIKVTLGRGSTACKTKDKPQCGAIHLRLDGFQASGHVICKFAAQNGPQPADVDATTDADGHYEADGAQYATSTATLQVTCESVQDTYNWPG